MRTILYYCVCALVCTACASQPPKPVRIDLAANPGFSQVYDNINAYVGQQVRWGGTLQSIHNLANATELEVIARPLDSSTRPDIFGNSPGRFIALVQGFLDPSDFERGREITIVGTIKGASTRSIGEFDYRYPIISASAYYLWPKRYWRTRPAPGYYNDYPFWYDPWYGWYPWSPWWYY